MSGLTDDAAAHHPPTSVTKRTASAASSAAHAIGGVGFFVFAVGPATDPATNTGLYILFGGASVADVSAANGRHIAPNTEKRWLIPDGITHYKVIRSGSADASLEVARS